MNEVVNFNGVEYVKKDGVCQGVSLEKQRMYNDDYFIGKYLLVRTYSAGAHFGKLLAKSGTECLVGSARIIWDWERDRFTLREIANRGVVPEAKITEPVSEVILSWIELIECTDIAIDSLKNIPSYDC